MEPDVPANLRCKRFYRISNEVLRSAWRLERRLSFYPASEIRCVDQSTWRDFLECSTPFSSRRQLGPDRPEVARKLPVSQRSMHVPLGTPLLEFQFLRGQ
jgi:hypothetical protein